MVAGEIPARRCGHEPPQAHLALLAHETRGIVPPSVTLLKVAGGVPFCAESHVMMGLIFWLADCTVVA